MIEMVDLLNNSNYRDTDVKEFFKKNDYLFADPFSLYVDIDSYIDKVNKFGNIFIAWDDSGIIGIAGGYANDKETYCAHLQFLLVKSSEQSKGMGRALLKAFMENARRAGMKKLILTIDERNQKAQRMYLKSGFVFSDAPQPNEYKRIMEYALV